MGSTLKEVAELHEKVDVPLSLSLPSYNNRGCSQQSQQAENLQEIMQNLNNYMQDKIGKESEVQFDSNNLELLKSFGVLDPGSDKYLDFNTFQYCIDHLKFLGINCSLLMSDLERAKTDISLELPISQKRYKNLMKLSNMKNTVAASPASVECVFSGMNWKCTKHRTKLMPYKLGDFLTISMNRDMTVNLELDQIVDNWSKLVVQRVNVK